MSDRGEPLDRALEERPEGELAVPPTRVAGRRAGFGAGLVLAAGVAAIAGALLIAQPGPVRPAPSALPASPAAGLPTAGPASPPPPAAGEARAIPPRLSRGDLTVAVLDGSLEGRLVFVDGVLRATPVRCQSLAQASRGCVTLDIPGLGLPVWAGPTALPWRGDPPPGAWIVTVARTGGLVYLGSLLPEADVPDSIGGLTRRLHATGLAEPPRTLFEVTSWLVVDGDRPCSGGTDDTTPCPTLPPFLARDEPFADGSLRTERGGAVELASPVVGLDPSPAHDERVVHGTFLVTLPEACTPADPAATCVGIRWLVVARYDPERSVRVLAP